MELSNIKSPNSGDHLQQVRITDDELEYLLYSDTAAAQAHKEHQTLDQQHKESLERLHVKTNAVQEFYNYLSKKYGLTERHTITKSGEIVLDEV